ncbi:MAG TPA: Rieske 2Fe-2S domain-containing protein [Chloroflexota bacterium]
MAATAVPPTGAGSTRVMHQDLLKTGPGTLAGRYLRSFWQPVRLASHVKPGRALPIRIMSEDFTLYRGESGEPHLLTFRCAHRGTQLSTGWVEGDNLRCFYHGWKYDPNGQCLEQPAEPEPFCSRIKIRAYPTREYLGFVWAYLGEGEPPEFPRVPEFERPDYVVNLSYLEWPVNYFTQIDNAVDQAHTAMTHWHFGRGVPTIRVDNTDYGVAVHASGPGYRNPSHFHMPNAHEWGSPPRPGGADRWSYARGWRVPIDDSHYIRFGIDIVPLTGEEADKFQERMAEREKKITRLGWEVGEDVLAGRMAPQELDPELYPDLVNIQDYIAQVGIGDIAENPPDEHLGSSDMAIVKLRRLWARELEALAAGRPLTQWRRPDSLWSGLSATGE